MLRAVGVEVGVIVGMFVVVGMLMGMGVGVGNAVMGMLVGMGVLMLVVMAAGHMFGIDMHRIASFIFFLILYPRKAHLSKHLFLCRYPPGGLAKYAEKRYTIKDMFHPRKRGKTMTDHTHESCDAHDHEHDHAYLHAHGIPHSHGHVHENQKAVLNRLSRAIGHLEKVKRMVEEGHDCSEVLIQLAAVRSALDNTGKVILKDHMRHCMVDAVAAGDQDAIDDLCQAIDKFMK